jgi:hypothetical protein
MKHILKHIFLAAFLVLAGSWAAGQNAQAFAPGVHPAVIFVANDAGDTTALTDNLCEVLSGTKWPMKVDTTRWSAFGGPFRDYNYVSQHRAFGLRMACRIQAAQRVCPGAKTYLMGHGAGAAVVLAAAESLPPGSVDRIVLLAPAVSTTYDLRPALRTSREGIDVYYSLQDGHLIDARDIIGNADCVRDVPAAGVVGFRCPCPAEPDSGLYCLVRQFPFNPLTYECTGNQGSHCGPIHYGFLRLVVLTNMVAFYH